MDNNFWISAAIAAVVGGAWLFKKGKSTYSFIRKIRRSFKGVCLNPKSRLTDEQCKKIAIGAMYASQQGAYQNSIETGIPDMLPKILGEWWGIETTQEDYDKIVMQFQNLQETYEELLSCKVIVSKEDLKRYGVAGWDAGRICFLARACCEMDYISEADAWRYIDVAYDMAHSAFSSWNDMAMSYVIGRSLWGGKSAYNSVMKSTADELLTHENSPWRKYVW